MGLYKKEKREQQQITQASIIIKAVKKIREEQPKTGARKLQNCYSQYYRSIT
jgi:hypothetical protein